MKLFRNLAVAIVFAIVAFTTTAPAGAQQYSQCAYVAGFVEQQGGQCAIPFYQCTGSSYQGYYAMDCNAWGSEFTVFCCAWAGACPNPDPPNSYAQCDGG